MIVRFGASETLDISSGFGYRNKYEGSARFLLEAETLVTDCGTLTIKRIWE
jgi:hypothetical protein